MTERVRRMLPFLAVAITLALTGAVVAASAWFFWLDPISPIQSASQVRVVDDDGILDRPTPMHVERTLCVSHGAYATVRRRWVDGVIYTVPDTHLRLYPGCRTRTALVTIPASLPPGTYSYEIALMFRNRVGREVAVHLPAVTVAVSAADWPPPVVSPNGVHPDNPF